MPFTPGALAGHPAVLADGSAPPEVHRQTLRLWPDIQKVPDARTADVVVSLVLKQLRSVGIRAWVVKPEQWQKSSLALDKCKRVRVWVFGADQRSDQKGCFRRVLQDTAHTPTTLCFQQFGTERNARLMIKRQLNRCGLAHVGGGHSKGDQCLAQRRCRGTLKEVWKLCLGNVGPRSAQSSCLQRPCGDDGVRKAKLKRCLLKGSQAELPKVFAAVVGFSSVARAKRRARQPAQNVDLELGMIDGGEAQHSERVGRWGREACAALSYLIRWRWLVIGHIVVGPADHLASWVHSKIAIADSEDVTSSSYLAT